MSHNNEIPEIVPRVEEMPEVDQSDRDHYPGIGDVGDGGDVDSFLDEQQEKDRERDEGPDRIH